MMFLQEGRCGSTVLHQAVRCRDMKTVRFLLSFPSINVNQCLYNGCSALGLARSLPHPEELVQLLMQHGAVTSCKDKINESNDSTSEEDDSVSCVLWSSVSNALSLRSISRLKYSSGWRKSKKHRYLKIQHCYRFMSLLSLDINSVN